VLVHPLPLVCAVFWPENLELQQEQPKMLRLAILLAGLIVCLPAIGVVIALMHIPGAAVAAGTAFAVLYSPFVVAALLANRIGDFFREAAH
jgi:heme A synthase